MSARLATTLGVVVVMLGLVEHATAAETLVEGDVVELRLGGFASEFAGVSHLPWDTAGLVPDTSGVNAGVFRLELNGAFGERVTAEVHSRLFHSIRSAPSLGSGSTGLGLGASVAPDRTLNTRSVLVEEEGLLVEHDLDRAVVNVFTPVGDLYIGRQAITWGNSNLFPVADVWTRFSPFELDVSQKRGVDAVRFLGYPGEIELDLIFEWTDVESPGGGVRASWTANRTDSYAALAWSGDRLRGLMGLGVDLEWARAHGEFNLPFDPDSGQLELPRAALGLDWIGQEFTVIAEYSWNGPGTTDPKRYLEESQEEDVRAGDRYLLGRHYAGLATRWQPNETYGLGVSAIANLVDPSLIVTPTATLSVSQNVTVSAGAYVGIGSRPTLTPVPEIRSEFGAVGELYFVQMTAYY